MKFIFATVAAVIAISVGMLLIHLGAFKAVEITAAEAGPLRLVYRRHTGAYHRIVPVIEAVEKWAQANGETCNDSFGEYLEDPNTVDEDRLHSNGGCLVKNDWTGKLPPDFFYREIPRRNYVIAEFAGAPSIGPQKVYPRVKTYMDENSLRADGAVIEIYERQGERMKTHYHFPAASRPKSV